MTLPTPSPHPLPSFVVRAPSLFHSRFFWHFRGIFINSLSSKPSPISLRAKPKVLSWAHKICPSPLSSLTLSPHTLYLTQSVPAKLASLLVLNQTRQCFHLRAFSKLFLLSDSLFPPIAPWLSPSLCLSLDLLAFSFFLLLPLIPS